MAWLFSTGLKEALGKKKATAISALSATTISFGDGTGASSRDQILDSGNGLAGFVVGDHITVLGSTSNNIDARILSVAAGAIEIAAGSLSTEAAGDTVVLITCEGGSITDIFKNFTMMLYTGARTSSADDAEVGTKLVQVTRDGNTFVSESPGNGLNFADGGSLVLDAETDPATGIDEVAKGEGEATGSAQSCWIYANTVVQGASTSAIRMVGQVAVSGAEGNMPTGTTVTSGVDIETMSIALTL